MPAVVGRDASDRTEMVTDDLDLLKGPLKNRKCFLKGVFRSKKALILINNRFKLLLPRGNPTKKGTIN